MKVFVCVKNVPDTAANIRVVGENSFDESIKFLINPYDEYAIEEAARLVEKEGGEVVLVTVGKESAIKTVRSALALGSHRAILVTTDKQFLDSADTAAIRLLERTRVRVANDGRRTPHPRRCARGTRSHL